RNRQECCDFTFNQQGFVFQCQWEIPPIDLNLSRNLPKYKDGFEMFAYDTPLTEMGYLQSKLTGFPFLLLNIGLRACLLTVCFDFSYYFIYSIIAETVI
ncbi:Uncharacterized protein BM_BM5657, partial [Brugia malayi]|uniref:Bm5657 n=1 Tax=Brugia malayi TaxID=6279 RepID=A0A0K0JJT1_BRUMA